MFLLDWKINFTLLANFFGIKNVIIWSETKILGETGHYLS